MLLDFLASRTMSQIIPIIHKLPGLRYFITATKQDSTALEMWVEVFPIHKLGTKGFEMAFGGDSQSLAIGGLS